LVNRIDIAIVTVVGFRVGDDQSTVILGNVGHMFWIPAGQVREYIEQILELIIEIIYETCMPMRLLYVSCLCKLKVYN